jgi:hypothetical protein
VGTIKLGLEMSFDRLLGIGGVVLGVLGILAAYFFYRKSVRTKVLAIAYTDLIPVLMTLEDINVSYMGTSVTALSRMYFLLRNRGTAPIESSDFISPIHITSEAPLLKIEVFDKDSAVAATLDSNSKTLQIDLLRPGEAIVLHAEVASETVHPNLQVQMKSPDMSTFTRALWAVYPGLFAFLLALFVLFVQFGVLYHFGAFNPPDPSAAAEFERYIPSSSYLYPLFMIASLLLFGVLICILPISIGTIVYKIHSKIYSRLVGPIAWQFS